MKAFHLRILVVLSLLASTGRAQLNYTFNQQIPVVINTDTLKNAWAGGLDAPQFSEIDLNGDGIKDLFVFDRQGNSMRTFINLGTTGLVSYRYAPEYRAIFPQDMYGFALLHDFDCDGYEDLFTATPAGMRVYHNDYPSNGSLSFSLYMPLIYTYYYSNTVNLLISPVDIPGFIDVDEDGDMDILLYGGPGGPTANTVEWHQNMAEEYFGRCDTMVFERNTGCWGHFYENALSCKLVLGWFCKSQGSSAPPPPPDPATIHSGSSVLLLDVNGDTLKDLVVGDIGCTKLNILINQGDLYTANMVSTDSSFPANYFNTVQTDIQIFPAAYYLDVDNDNVKDLIAAPNYTNSAENYNSVWRWSNDSLTNYPKFKYEQNDFLQQQMIETGEQSFPVFFDADADGLYDLLIGSYGYYNRTTNQHDGSLTYFRNVGTQIRPVFEFQTTDYQNLGALGLNAMKPTFGDMDADGDEDMIIGDFVGNLHLFDNVAGAGNPASFVLSEFKMDGIDVGDDATPYLFDMDGDNDLDLVIGQRNGELSYFENQGTPGAKVFSAAPTYSLFGGIDVETTFPTGFSVPFVAVQDSVLLLYVGSEKGMIYIYDSIAGNLGGTFHLKDSIVTYDKMVSPDGADLTGNDTLELVIGEAPGGAGMYLASRLPAIISVDEYDGYSNMPITVYPNPAHDALHIHLPADPPGVVRLDLYDARGRKIVTSEGYGHYFTLSTAHLAPGVYLLYLSNEAVRGVRKVIIR